LSRLVTDTEKECSRCDAVKPLSAFHKNPRCRGGVDGWCRDCHREYARVRIAKDRLRHAAKAKAWRAANPESVKAILRKHREANKEAHAAFHKAWAEANRDRRRAVGSRYRAALLQAIPAWASPDKIAAIYKRAMEIERETGKKHQVDHIVPLQSKIVCGLHCEANLQVLTASENASKKNYWWPDMPLAGGASA
jgi:hypothetical protein